ncbi:MAG: rubrerythrin family protein [Firmicutes bacterium]|nr:rubrerythrin family protein [Bacillota bacterium]
MADDINKIMEDDDEMLWICPLCGYAHGGQNPPDKCPLCGAPGSTFRAS